MRGGSDTAITEMCQRAPAYNVSMQLSAIRHLDTLHTRFASIDALLVQNLGHCRIRDDFSTVALQTTNAT